MGKLHPLPRLDLEGLPRLTDRLDFQAEGKALHLLAAPPGEDAPQDVPAGGRVQAVVEDHGKGLVAGLHLVGDVPHAGAAAHGQLLAVDLGRHVEEEAHGAFRLDAGGLLPGVVADVVPVRGKVVLLLERPHGVHVHLAAEIHNQSLGGGIHPRHHPVGAKPLEFPAKGQQDGGALPAGDIPEVTFAGDAPGGQVLRWTVSLFFHKQASFSPWYTPKQALSTQKKAPGSAPGAWVVCFTFFTAPGQSG